MPHHVFAAGETLPASRLRDLFDHGTYTPTLTASTTNPSLGTLPVQDGRFTIKGLHEVTVFFEIAFGSGVSAGSGVYRISLPAAWPIDSSIPSKTAIGQVRLRDSSAPSERCWGLIVPTSATDRNYIEMMEQTASAGQSVTNAVPWTWADNDSMRGSCTYFTTGT